MFATFCFQHMSLHIQAPKKDPDYEEEDNDMVHGPLLVWQRTWRLVTFDTFEKAAFMVCSTIIREIYISKFINFKCCIWMSYSTYRFFFKLAPSKSKLRHLEVLGGSLFHYKVGPQFLSSPWSSTNSGSATALHTLSARRCRLGNKNYSLKFFSLYEDF